MIIFVYTTCRKFNPRELNIAVVFEIVLFLVRKPYGCRHDSVVTPIPPTDSPHLSECQKRLIRSQYLPKWPLRNSNHPVRAVCSFVSDLVTKTNRAWFRNVVINRNLPI